MKILMDTHIFLWLNLEPEKIPKHLYQFLLDYDNQLFLSHVSIWEMMIKSELGKLQLNQSIEEMITTQIQENDVKLLSIDLKHIYKLKDLPQIHKDPFDRLLIAQSISENMFLMSVDQKFSLYKLNQLLS